MSYHCRFRLRLATARHGVASAAWQQRESYADLRTQLTYSFPHLAKKSKLDFYCSGYQMLLQDVYLGTDCCGGATCGTHRRCNQSAVDSHVPRINSMPFCKRCQVLGCRLSVSFAILTRSQVASDGVVARPACSARLPAVPMTVTRPCPLPEPMLLRSQTRNNNFLKHRSDQSSEN